MLSAFGQGNSHSWLVDSSWGPRSGTWHRNSVSINSHLAIALLIAIRRCSRSAVRERTYWTSETALVAVNIHDLRSHADGMAIAHDICDTPANRGFVRIDISRDTPFFAVDNRPLMAPRRPQLRSRRLLAGHLRRLRRQQWVPNLCLEVLSAAQLLQRRSRRDHRCSLSRRLLQIGTPSNISTSSSSGAAYWRDLCSPSNSSSTPSPRPQPVSDCRSPLNSTRSDTKLASALPASR